MITGADCFPACVQADQLVLELFAGGSEGGPLLAAVAALHHQQLGTSVQKVGRRERDLQSPAIVVDPVTDPPR